MKRRLAPALLLLPLAACAAEGRVIHGDPYHDPYRDRGYHEGGHGGAIPPGHQPPPGHCRDWDPALPPGQQPPPYPC